MATTAESAAPQSLLERVRRVRGWRMALLLLSPYLAIQVFHQAAPGLFPDVLSKLGEFRFLPDWANEALLHLKNEQLFGLFNFKDFTRTVSGLLERPLDLSEQLLIAGDGPFGLGAVPWVVLVGLFAVTGAKLGGWRLALLGGGCSLYLAVFNVWENAIITLSIVLVVAPVAAAIGWAAGLAAAKAKWFESLLVPVLNVMQSMPHFSYLLPISVFIGIGDEAGAIATILFAVPPMARLTILGLRSVPSEVLEAGLTSGCNRWQMLWKVEMPASRPQLLVGVNQVVMQCFGMTVLASFVGTRGLGLPLLNYLQSLRIGKALEVGVAIVAMAIMLDRLSQAAGARRPEHVDPSKSWMARHPFWIAAAAVSVVGTVLAQITDHAKVLPKSWTISTAPLWEWIVDWVQLNLKGPLGHFRDFMILQVLFPMRDGFESLPWIGLLVLVAAVGWRFGRMETRRDRFAVCGLPGVLRILDRVDGDALPGGGRSHRERGHRRADRGVRLDIAATLRLSAGCAGHLPSAAVVHLPDPGGHAVPGRAGRSAHRHRHLRDGPRGALHHARLAQRARRPGRGSRDVRLHSLAGSAQGQVPDGVPGDHAGFEPSAAVRVAARDHLRFHRRNQRSRRRDPAGSNRASPRGGRASWPVST